jgi:hypothetical protein
MRNLRTTLYACVLAAMLSPPAFAQGSGHDVAGHWDGLASTPLGPQPISFDVARQPDGSFRGTMSSSELEGLPLATIAQTGDKVRFVLPAGLAISFQGDLDAKGQVMSGVIATPQGEMGLSLTRNGDAEFPPPPANPRIEPRLEGAGVGAVDLGGRQMHVRLTLANRPEGANGVLASLDEGYEAPLAISGDPSKLKLEVHMTGGEWDGALNPAGDALVGVYSSRGATFSMNLKRQ